MKSLKLLITLCLKVIINKRLQKKFKRTCELLIHFEGLQCIAANPEEHWIVFAESLSKNAYWVKVTVTD